MNMLARTLMVAALAAAAVGCAKDSADLGEQVMREMQEELVTKTGLKDLKMKSVKLIRKEKDGIDYNGVGKGEIAGEPIEFAVNCKYDGSTVLWDAELTSDSMATLAAKEKTREAVAKIKAAWPGIKQGIKDKVSTARAAAKSAYDKASRKTAEIYNEAKGRFSSESSTPAAEDAGTPVPAAK